MTNNELIIEKLNVDVFAKTEQNPNALLYHIMQQLKQIVLPQIEKEMDQLDQEIDVSIDRLNLEFDLDNYESWVEVLGHEIANEIIASCEKRHINDQIKPKTGLPLDRSIESESSALVNLINSSSANKFTSYGMEFFMDNILAHVFFQFLRTGYVNLNQVSIELELHNLSTNNDEKEALLHQKDRYDLSNFENFEKMESFWLQSDQKAHFFQLLAHFLNKNASIRLRFLNQTSFSFLRELIIQLCSEQLASFLCDFYHFHSKNDQLSTFLLKIMLELANFDQKVSVEKFMLTLNNKNTQFRDFLNHFIAKNDQIISKHHKITQLLMKNYASHNSDSLSKIIEEKSDHSLFVFIQYLRSDLSLREKLDPLIIQFYQGVKQRLTCTDWCTEFANSFYDRMRITDVLIELEELKPINGQLKKPEFFAAELIELITALEKRLTILEQLPAQKSANDTGVKGAENSKTEDESQEKLINAEDQYSDHSSSESTSDLEKDFFERKNESPESDDNKNQAVSDEFSENTQEGETTEQKEKMNAEQTEGNLETRKTLQVDQLDTGIPISLVDQIIPIVNAGIVLLNPFLPTLFKNLRLQNTEGEWKSHKHQAVGIYALQYLAEGNWESSEDQLLLYKIVVGYDLNEILPTFNDLKESMEMAIDQLTKQVDEIEIPNLLIAVQENWRPMRNCTWEGLKKDFLSRSGNLTQKEDLQYVLTIEPHALDVLLPHKKWGMSMIKFSWMEEVLNVEWGV